jgi:hypothetical protein
MIKTCNHCGQTKDVSLFKEGGKKPTCKSCDAVRAKTYRQNNTEAVNQRSRSKYQGDSIARETRNARTRSWRERIGKEAVRAGDERSRYGTTRKELGSTCAICGTTKHLCVDHDHACCPGARSCGKCVRDVLCVSCNTFIGKIEATPGRLAVATGYLTLWKAQF